MELNTILAALQRLQSISTYGLISDPFQMMDAADAESTTVLR